MTTAKDLARFYARYWTKNQAGQWILADNAPTAFWKFAVQLPEGADRTMLHAALNALATGNAQQAPDPADILRWFASHPTAVHHCDEVLSSKRPPKSFATLMEKAYKAELFSILDRVHAFLTAEIAKEK